MQLYRSKPVVIQAVRWDGTNFGEIEYISRYCNPKCGIHLNRDGTFTISTLEGDMILRVGNWLIKGNLAELYPCSDTVFQQKYEVITSG